MGDHYDDDDDDDEDVPGKKKRFNSYSVKPGRSFLPIAEAVSGLPSAFYKTHHTYEGIVFNQHDVNSDELMEIPGSLVDDIFRDMNTFWKQHELYTKLRLTHKRGYLLHGPPGTGKSAAVVMLGNRVIASGGAVIYPTNENQFVDAVDVLRTSEKGRPLMFIIEEITEFLDKKESEILAVLDGEGSPANSVFVATTNNLSDLNDNIRKRPGRFDRVFKVDFPSDRVRYAYAMSILKRADVPDAEREASKVAGATKDMSLAHVKEVIVGSLILGQSMDEILSRLK